MCGLLSNRRWVLYVFVRWSWLLSVMLFCTHGYNASSEVAHILDKWWLRTDSTSSTFTAPLTFRISTFSYCNNFWDRYKHTHDRGGERTSEVPELFDWSYVCFWHLAERESIMQCASDVDLAVAIAFLSSLRSFAGYRIHNKHTAKHVTLQISMLKVKDK